MSDTQVETLVQSLTISNSPINTTTPVISISPTFSDGTVDQNSFSYTESNFPAVSNAHIYSAQANVENVNLSHFLQNQHQHSIAPAHVQVQSPVGHAHTVSHSHPHYPTMTPLSPVSPTVSHHHLPTEVTYDQSSTYQNLSTYKSRLNGGLGPRGPYRSHHDNSKLSKTNLYIKSLPIECDDDFLRSLCEPYGNIVSTKAILDPNDNNKCKGYGFVDFESADCAELAVKELNKKHIPAQMAKQQEQDPTNLYFSYLPLELSEADLEEILSIFGIVISTRILRDSDCKSKGVGFARMESSSVCDSVIDHFNNLSFQDALVDLIENDDLRLPNLDEYKFSEHPIICKLADGGTKKRTRGFVKPVFGSSLHWTELPADASLFEANAGFDQGVGLYRYIF